MESYFRDEFVSIRFAHARIFVLRYLNILLPIFAYYLQELSVKLASKLAEDSKGSEFEGMGKGLLEYAILHKVQ